MTGINKQWKWVEKTGTDLIDGVISGDAWGDANITFSFPSSTSHYNYTAAEGNEASNNFGAISAAQQNAARFALDLAYGTSANDGFSVEGFTNLGVAQGTATDAHIRFAQSDEADPTAYAYYPGTWEKAGDIWFSTYYAGTENDYRKPVAGNYAWQTLIHELGHALGLKHGHEADNGVTLPADKNSVEYSVMTYHSYVGSNGYYYEPYGAPQTFMMADIAALQQMYGADYTTQSGNTVYKWTPGSGDTLVNGQVGIDAGGNRIFATLWDGGGEDTFDLTAYKTNLKIDLRPGQYSVFDKGQLAYLGGGPNDGYARGNIFNALLYKGDTRSLIENVKGGSGSDTITGNQVDNKLYGNGGNDTLNGDAGDDLLVGGAGADKLNGGSGVDTASYAEASKGVTVSLLTTKSSANDAKGDIFVSVENIIGTSYTDVITGDANANLLRGEGGNDTLNGGDGNDTLIGGGGADKLFGGGGTDTVSYAGATKGVVANLFAPGGNTNDATGDTYSSIDILIGTSFADVLTGNKDSNVIRGGDGNDTLNDDQGNDILLGGLGADRLNGGSGTDTASYAEAASAVLASLLTPTKNTGEATGDSYISIENLIGSKFSDTLQGNADANTLSGGDLNDSLLGEAGNDALKGEAGNDFLSGGLGADRLYGGAGGDKFIFKSVQDSTVASTGRDTIYDFVYAEGDRIDLSGIDANTKVASDQAFNFIGNGAFTGTAGQLRSVVTGNTTLISGDTDGDKIADFAIYLDDAIAFQKGYFVL